MLLLLAITRGFAQHYSIENPMLLPKPPDNIQKLAYSTQGNYLGAIALQHTFLLYDGEGLLIRQYSAPVHTYWADAAFSPDEKLLALANVRNDSTFLQLYRLETGELWQSVFLFAATLSVMEWHADGEVLVCASDKRQIQAWQYEENQLKRVYQTDWDKSDLDEAWTIAATANGRLWAIAGVGGDLLLYEWKKQDLNLRQALKIEQPVYSLAFHPTEALLCISTAQQLKFYQYQKKERLQEDALPTLATISNQLLFLKRDKGLIVVQAGKLVQYTKNETESMSARVIWQNEAHILAHALHPYMKYWAIATADGKLQLFFVKEK